MVHKRKMKTKCKRRSKIAHIAWTKRIRKHTDTCWRKRGCLPSIPKLRCLSLLEYLLGVPRASPSLSSCLSSFFSHRDLLDHRTLHPDKTSTENSVRSISIIKQITTLSTVTNCRCQNWRILGRGSRTVRLRLMVTWGGGHNVYPGSGPLDGGNTLLPARLILMIWVLQELIYHEIVEAKP